VSDEIDAVLSEVIKSFKTVDYNFKRCGFKPIDGKLMWFEEELPAGGWDE